MKDAIYLVLVCLVTYVKMNHKSCSAGWRRFNKHCYKFFSEHKSWEDARRLELETKVRPRSFHNLVESTPTCTFTFKTLC